MYNQQAYAYLYNTAAPGFVAQPYAVNGPIVVPPPVVQQTTSVANPTSTTLPNSRISTDTSSRNPEDLASRIFIGNVSAITSRDDVIDACKPFGAIKAVAMFKGFAFVQFYTAEDANMAVNGLHSYNLKGAALDVRIVSVSKQGAQSKKSNADSNAALKRPKNDFIFGGIKMKPEAANHRNSCFAEDVHKQLDPMEFHEHGKEDLLMCGSCRSQFHSIPEYIDHRRKPCVFFQTEICPSILSCFTCDAEFKEPWTFLQHLVHKHSINMFKGQPKSDPAWFAEKYGDGNVPESEDESDENEVGNSDKKASEEGTEPSSTKGSAGAESPAPEPQTKKARVEEAPTEPAVAVSRPSPLAVPPPMAMPPVPPVAFGPRPSFPNPAGTAFAPNPAPVFLGAAAPSTQPVNELPQGRVPPLSTGLSEAEQLRMLEEFDMDDM